MDAASNLDVLLTPPPPFLTQNAARQAVAAGTQLMNSAKQANKSNRNHASQQQLVVSSQALDEQIPDLVQALRGVQKSRDNATAQLTLINASQDFIQVMVARVSSSCRPSFSFPFFHSSADLKVHYQKA